MHYIEAENRHQCTMGFILDEIISTDNAVRIIDAIVEEIYKSNKESSQPTLLPHLPSTGEVISVNLFNYFKIDCYIVVPCPHPSTNTASLLSILSVPFIYVY